MHKSLQRIMDKRVADARRTRESDEAVARRNARQENMWGARPGTVFTPTEEVK